METKNSIKQRMISVAAKAWGVTSKDIEKSDPIIPLLIDACASEIAKVSSSINESRDKMAGKIMELITPAELSGPYPARAILHAMPMETFCNINEDNEFYYIKRNYLRTDNQDVEIFFTPTGNHRLIKGEVRYLGCHKSIYLKPGPNEKISFIDSKKANAIEPNTLWIGLHIPKPINSLDGISFYFDLENTPEIEEEMFYNALAKSQWEINGKNKSVTSGFKIDISGNSEVRFTNSAKEFNKSMAVCDHINNFYKKKFITILEDDNDVVNYKELTMKYPDAFREVFSNDDLEEIEGNLLWIKIRFLQHVPFEVFQNVNCTMNCFPVINRRSEKIYITGKDKIAALISEDNEMFFDLKSIDAEGNMKIFLSGNVTDDKEEAGLLTLRQDNIGRYNSRNALELIQQMIDVYRDEFIAFSKFKNINQDSVEDLHNAIRPFENVLDELYDISIDSLPYIMLKTSPENENLNVEVSYWLTNGTLANDIQKEESLKYDSAELVRDKVFLMTPTYGGIDRKKNDQLINDFRYTLLTRDRIVTKADIKALCFKVFENFISEVEVKDGISGLTQPGSGLRRTIDIFITLSEHRSSDEEVIKFLKEDLQTQLEEKSSNTLPYKIFIT